MTKTLIFFGLCCFEISGYSQDIKEILSESDNAILNEKGLLIKSIDTTDRKLFEGFTGKVIITHKENKFQFYQVGLWERSNYKNNFDAEMNYDTIGNLINYKEFNKVRINIFECNYHYEITNDCTFRIEELKLFYDNGIPREKGWRYNKVLISDNKKDIKPPKKFGNWEYFNSEGKLVKTKSYGQYK